MGLGHYHAPKRCHESCHQHRVIIGGFLGAAALGAYAVCARVSAIAELVRAAINQGMSCFIYSTVRDAGHARKMCLISSGLLILAAFLFGSGIWLALVAVDTQLPSQYQQAAAVMPFLKVGPLMLTVFQTVGAEVVLSEKIAWITWTQIGGVLIAVLFSFFSVTLLGIVDPAIGEYFGYTVMLVSILTAVKVTGREVYARYLLMWISQLIVAFLSTFSTNEVLRLVGMLIAISSPVWWIVIHRKDYLRFVMAVKRLALGT